MYSDNSQVPGIKDFLLQLQTPREVFDITKRLDSEENPGDPSGKSKEKSINRLLASDIEEVRAIFNIFDISQTGKLTAEDIYRAVRMLGESIDMVEAQEMIRIGDRDEDGYINFEDFLYVSGLEL